METMLANTYRHIRAKGATATRAMEAARALIEQGKGNNYSPSRAGAYNPPFQAHGYSALRWIESTDAAGLRFVGYADELISVGHRGWFADAFQDETYRGAVYQLPARGGRPCLVAGYADPNNKGAAIIDFSPEYGEAREEVGRYSDATREAACMADGMAECFAEEARDYSEAWQAARQWQELADDMANARASARTLVAEMRAAIKAGQSAGAAICAALRAQLASYADAWQSARDEREKLAKAFYFCLQGKSVGIAEFAASEL